MTRITGRVGWPSSRPGFDRGGDGAQKVSCRYHPGQVQQVRCKMALVSAVALVSAPIASATTPNTFVS